MDLSRITELLEAIQALDPPTGDLDIAALRERIDTIDSVIVELLNERALSANHIGRIKKDLGIPVYAPSREEEVLGNVQACNPGPLSATAIQRLFERIIDETRSLERQRYQDDEKTSGDDSGNS